MREFLIISAPVTRLRSESSTVLRAQPDPLASLGERLVHPESANLRTFGLVRDGRSRLTVAEPRLLAALDSPGHRNILWFEQPPAEEVLAIEVPGTTVWFARCTAGDLGLGRGVDELRLAAGLGNLYREQPTRPDGRPYRRMPTAATASPERADVYLNPLIVRLAVDGTEVAAGGQDGMLAGLTTPASVLLAEPLVDAEEDFRMAVWAKIRRDLRARTAPPLLGLPWSGPDGDGDRGLCRNEAGCGAVLDLLGGTFQIDSPTARRRGRLAWVAPDRAANRDWLARRLCDGFGCEYRESSEQLWHGIEGTPSPRRWPDEAIVWLDDPHPERVAGSAAELLRRLTPHGRGPLARTIGFVLEVLSDVDTGTSEPSRSHRNFVQFRSDLLDPMQDRGVPLGLELLAFLDRFSRRWALPQSRLQVGFPREPIAQAPFPQVTRDFENHYRRATAGRCLEPLRALAWGGWRWLDSLLRPMPAPAETRLPLHFGWWTDWIEWLLQTATRQSTLSLCVPGRGFRWRDSRLGSAGLRWRAPEYRPDSEMRA